MKQGQIRITHKALAQLLGLPENVGVKDLYSDPIRNRTVIIVQSSDYAKGYTFDLAEGSEVPIVENISSFDPDDISPTHMRIYEMVRDKLIGAVLDGDDEIACTCDKDVSSCYLHAHYVAEL